MVSAIAVPILIWRVVGLRLSGGYYIRAAARPQTLSVLVQKDVVKREVGPAVDCLNGCLPVVGADAHQSSA